MLPCSQPSRQPRGAEARIVAPPQDAARFGTERDEGIHRIGESHGHQPGHHVGKDQRPVVGNWRSSENAEIDGGVDNADQRENWLP